MKQLYSKEEFNKSGSREKLPCQCYQCNSTFFVFKSNISQELKQKRGRVKFCSQICSTLFNSPPTVVSCINCNKDFNKSPSEIKRTRNNFCSNSCANTYNGRLRTHSDKTKTKISDSLSISFFNKRKTNKNKREIDKIKNCKNCNKVYHSRIKTSTFCSRGCRSSFFMKIGLASIMGKKSIEQQGDSRRSKNEIYFSELCKQKFKSIKCNEPMFNGWDADIIIPELKLAVLWNGVWHYKKITKKHSVEMVQNRDKIKLKEIAEKGYQSYTIKDMGKYDKKFVENKFKEMLVFLKL